MKMLADPVDSTSAWTKFQLTLAQRLRCQFRPVVRSVSFPPRIVPLFRSRVDRQPGSDLPGSWSFRKALPDEVPFRIDSEKTAVLGRVIPMLPSQEIAYLSVAGLKGGVAVIGCIDWLYEILTLQRQGPPDPGHLRNKQVIGI